MFNVLRGAALAVLCSLAFAAPAIAAGPNCTSSTITTFNALPSSSNALSTTGSYVGQTFSAGGPTSTIYTGADSKMATVTFQITGTFQGTLFFQGSQDEGSTYFPLTSTAQAGSQAPSGTFTTVPGNWFAPVSGLGAARVTALPTNAIPTWSGTATVYQCISSAAPNGQAAATAGQPFGFPLATNGSQWNGQNALLGPGFSMVPGQGVSPRISIARDTNPRFVIDDSFPTYRCSARFTPTATGAVTLISLRGSATSTVRVRKILLSGTSTALSASDFQMLRTTALGSGGTTVSPTVATTDTNYASLGAGALCSHYTSTLKATGTANGGPISTWVQFTDTVTTPTVATRPPNMVFPEGSMPGQSLILRGTGDFLEIQNLSPANLASGTILDYVLEWQETMGD